MKKILLPIGTLLLSGLVHAQLSPTENYVYSKTYLDYNTSNVATKTSESVQYFDGLGRPKQVVNVKASPTGKDVVTHIEYDGFGRQVKDYLPVPQQGTSGGAIYTSPLSNATQPTLYGAEKIYSEMQLENSPLDRILSQTQVGNAWDNKPVQFGYDANVDGEVKKYVATFNYTTFTSSLVLSGSYGTGQLYKNTVTDEDGNQTIEFKNGQGQLLLVRKVISATENANTYYVYNDYNQLAYVIPPKAAVVSDPNTVLSDLCYQYKYDGRNRLVEKKLPGKGWEFMVYDKADRLVATQDANLRADNQWLYTKYDQFGRIVMTGLSIGYGNTRLSEQDIADTTGSSSVRRSPNVSFIVQGIEGYYENYDQTYPNSSRWVKLLSVNYYDTYPVYSFNPTFPSTIIGQSVLTDIPDANGLSTKSLPVMSLIKNIEDDNWTKDYIYYDKKGRNIGGYSINHLGGYTKTESLLDFAGVPQRTNTYHRRIATDVEKFITEGFVYDSQNRLLQHYHKVDNNTEVVLGDYTYNELSQLSTKSVGNNLQSIDYAYNIHGWLTKINDPKNLNGKLFGYEIKYNQVEGEQTPDPFDTSLQVLSRYNGNIAEVDWRTSTASNDYLRRYGYVYDNLNRLSAGFYQREDNPSAGEYFEKMVYDLNGNITNLKRSASLDGNTTAGLIDNLMYEYLNNNSNRLNKVTDEQHNPSGYPYEFTPTAIAYDDNGNMTINADKGILAISYNHLNLPNYLLFKKGLSTHTGILRENTNYLYRSDGTKLRKVYNYSVPNPLGTITSLSAKITEYLDTFQYESTGKKISTLVLQFVPTPEGYYDFIKNKYIYNYTDHLGNVRLSYFNNGSGAEVLEENNYYPFGMKHEGYNTLLGNNSYQYKYNGKELQTESGMYDYGARMYMPDLGRWGVVDPLAEKMTRHSPYNYAFNNPIRFIDPDGRAPFGDYYNSQGKHLGSDHINDGRAYLATSRNADGTFNNARRLSVSNSVLNQLANTVAIESSGNWKESYALASTINNIAKSKNKTIENTLKTEGIFGYSDGGSSTDYKNNSEYSMQAALNAVMGGKDFSNGATKWDGVDFLAWGLNSPNGTPHNKFEEYGAIYIEAGIYYHFKNSIQNKYGNSTRYEGKPYNIPAAVYKNISNWKMPSLSVPWTGFMYNTGVKTSKSLDASASYGNTIFWNVIKE
jgi:RHS repeat-associated protein